jgi:tetratricopeptide (TPR) repeat protein
LQKYPEGTHGAEARLLLGESLLALGEGEAAITALKAVPPDSGRFFDEAWFKAADALRKLERFEEAQKHLDQYVKEHPASPRIAEAVWQMGKIDQQLKAPDKARKRYWDALDALSNDTNASGVEDLLTALPRLYASPTEQIHLAVELQTRAEAATKEGKLAAAVRYGWARGHLQRVIKPEAARAAFVTISHQINAERDHPRILIDVADAFRQGNAPKVAGDMYRQMRRWHPRSLERERASLGLAMLALQAGNKPEALTELDRCLRESLTGEVEGAALLERAALQLESKEYDAVRKDLGRITESKMMVMEHKARALLLLAKCEAAAGDFKKAGGHFNRGYLSFGKFKDLTAESYLGHGQMLEKQNQPDAARKVYEEFMGRKELATLPVAQKISQQLANLPPPAKKS